MAPAPMKSSFLPMSPSQWGACYVAMVRGARGNLPRRNFPPNKLVAIRATHRCKRAQRSRGGEKWPKEGRDRSSPSVVGRNTSQRRKLMKRALTVAALSVGLVVGLAIADDKDDERDETFRVEPFQIG